MALMKLQGPVAHELREQAVLSEVTDGQKILAAVCLHSRNTSQALIIPRHRTQAPTNTADINPALRVV